MNTCSTCRWWVPQETYSKRYGNVQRLGECRVKPPVAMLLQHNSEDGVTYQVSAEFPEVEEGAFCREHES